VRCKVFVVDDVKIFVIKVFDVPGFLQNILTFSNLGYKSLRKLKCSTPWWSIVRLFYSSEQLTTTFKI